MSAISYLSYLIEPSTPLYGGKDHPSLCKNSAIADGAVANNTALSVTSHVGTHLDMPYHFFEHGQTVEDFAPEFWLFQHPHCIEIQPRDLVIRGELEQALEGVDLSSCDLLMVRTGGCGFRDTSRYTDENYGFHPDVAQMLRQRAPKLRIFGFDSISVSSYAHRMIGREAHRAFLDPSAPILLLEDMDLRSVSSATSFARVIVAPLRLAKCDGLPCTVLGVHRD